MTGPTNLGGSPPGEAIERFRPPWAQEAIWSDVLGVHSLEPGDEMPESPYVVTRFVGDGEMGTVYEAEHSETGAPVIIKVLRPEVNDHPDQLDDFRELAAAVSLLESDDLVKLHEVTDVGDGRVLMVMDRVGGERLSDILSRGPLTPERAIGILRQVARGLGAAHGAGILHLDVKASSVMVEADGQPPDRARVKDFALVGLSGALLHGGLSTPRSIAPEAIREEPQTVRTDIYGLGCLAFEMLAGRPPFDSPDPAAIMQQHLQSTAPQLHGIVPEVKPQLSKVVARCLTKEPADRFASMADFEASLVEAQVRTGTKTDWDDLPLPDVADSRPAKIRQIEAGRAEPESGARAIPWIPIAVAVVVLGVGAALVLGRGDANDDGATVADAAAVRTTSSASTGADPLAEGTTAAGPEVAIPSGVEDTAGLAETSDPDIADDEIEPLGFETDDAKSETGELGVEAGAESDDGLVLEDDSPPAETPRERAIRLSQLGVTAFRRGHTERAKTYFEMALKSTRSIGLTHDGLSRYYYSKGNYSMAAQYGYTAIRLIPGNGHYRIRLGDALYKLHRYKDALEQYERAVKLGRTGLEPRLKRTRSNL